MLDTKSCRAEGGSLEVRVYRKKTHTDQYLNCVSNHPLHHKLGVVRTLLDRNDAITTKEEEKVKEEKHIRGALSKCGYPEWAVDRVNKMLQVGEGSTLGQRVYTWLFSTFFIPSNKKSIYRANAAHFGMFCALTDSKISGA